MGRALGVLVRTGVAEAVSPERSFDKFERHADACDDCDWFTLQFCLVGKELSSQLARSCASYRVPIVSIHRAGGKA